MLPKTNSRLCRVCHFSQLKNVRFHLGTLMSFTISKNITLSPITLLDAEDLLDLVESSRKNLRKYLPWVDSVKDLESTKEYISKRINSELFGAEWYTVLFSGSICGIFSIKSITEEKSIAEIGYWLSNHVHGNGVINLIILKLSGYLKNEMGVKALEFRCLEQNIASIKIALRSGAKFVRTHEHIEINNSKQALNIYRAQL